ncbi:hypothetical protein [Saccharothrix sp. ST-888]|uniref:hypothetical protein n=1 Tax=Saccharothrix sp. ST-888 TaxID=1427391 RepID=UPI0005EC59D5|nr:hypothetical protein [Saccharothrix sp. ST-888]KJK58572.1 hypothetical protein UK12_09390 [Saccharothrix sp. ST-888]
MRPSARIPSVLAGLALALGSVVVAAPAAHADLKSCQDYVQEQGTEVTDAVHMACYHGLVGDQPGCVSGLTQAGTARAVATEACLRAPQ